MTADTKAILPGTTEIPFDRATRNAGVTTASMAHANARLFPEAAPAADRRPVLSRHSITSIFGGSFAGHFARHLDGLGAQIAAWSSENKEGLALIATPADLAQELRWAKQMWAGGGHLSDEDCLGHCLRNADGEAFDVQYSTNFEAASVIIAKRKQAYLAFRHAMTAEVIVLLPSHNEVWRDNDSGLFLSQADALSSLRDRLSLLCLGYDQCSEMLGDAIAALLEMKPDLRIVLGVSPDNMAYTHTGRDILVANTAAKAVLRASIDAICTQSNKVSYFPAYEQALLTRQNYVYAHDNISVEQQFVGAIASSVFDTPQQGRNEEADIFDKALSLARSGKKDAALEIALPLHDREGFKPHHARALASWLIQKGRHAEAEAVIQVQYARSRRDPDLAHVLRAALIGSGNLEGALEAAKEASAGKPDQWQRELDVANVLFLLGRYEEADEIFFRHTENMDRFTYKVQYARVLVKLGQRDRMIELLAPTVNADTDASTLLEAVRMLKSVKAIEPAARLIQWARELYPNDRALSQVKA